MKPNTRIDNFLAKIAGDPDANTAMKPRSPEEYYLNQIAENGGGGGGGSTGGGVLVVGLDPQTGALDKTWQEINDAPLAIVKNEAGNILSGFVMQTQAVEGVGYMVAVAFFEAAGDEVSMALAPYGATTADGYPQAMNP